MPMSRKVDREASRLLDQLVEVLVWPCYCGGPGCRNGLCGRCSVPISKDKDRAMFSIGGSQSRVAWVCGSCAELGRILLAEGNGFSLSQGFLSGQLMTRAQRVEKHRAKARENARAKAREEAKQ